MAVNRNELMREKYPELLNSIVSMPVDRDKLEAFSNLFYTIMGIISR